jgi:hypothetical protein
MTQNKPQMNADQFVRDLGGAFGVGSDVALICVDLWLGSSLTLFAVTQT